MHAQFGRDFALGAGRLGPFVAFDHSVLRSSGTIEQGDTGLELMLHPARSTQSFAGAGMRYARDWEALGSAWQFNLDARYRHGFGDSDGQYAAFNGTPDATFDLAPWSRAGSVGALNLGLSGRLGRRWSGAFEYTQLWGSQARGGDWFIGLRRDL